MRRQALVLLATALLLVACTTPAAAPPGDAQVNSGGASPTLDVASAGPTAAETDEPSGTPKAQAVHLTPSVTAVWSEELVNVYEAEDGVVYVQVDSGVLRLEPETGTFEQVVDGIDPPWGLNIGFGSAWASIDPGGASHAGEEATGHIDRYDLATGDLIASVPVDELPVESITAYDSIWVPNDHSGTVTRIDPEANDAVATITVSGPPHGGPVHLAAGEDRIWASSPGTRLVTAIDPSTNEAVLQVALPGQPCGTAVAAALLWISRCTGAPVTWVHDPGNGEAITVVESSIVTDGTSVWATTVDPASQDVLLTGLDPESLEFGESVAIPGGPNALRLGASILWAVVGNELLGFPVEDLP